MILLDTDTTKDNLRCGVTIFAADNQFIAMLRKRVENFAV